MPFVLGVESAVCCYCAKYWSKNFVEMTMPNSITDFNTSFSGKSLSCTIHLSDMLNYCKL